MANETIRARIEVLLKGLDQVESLKNAVRQLQTTASPAAADLDKLKNAAMQLGGASSRTENDLRRSISALKDVRAQLSLTDREYAKLTGTINKYQAQLDKATGAQQQGGRGMRFAQTAGAVAASGVFGGPEGLIGAALGSFGGPGGALAGGAIGAQVGMARQQIGQFATYAADISKLEIALKGVTKTQEEYQRALAASASVTRDFNVPQLEATKGMTQLSAAVIGAGGKVADAEVVFRNVTSAIKASGGTSEDVQGALTALGQIFSKGKVSAEELQGQLGERLPGAVTMFAKATGRTLPQLQKDLEQGVVGLADLMKFVVSKDGLGQFEQRAINVAKSSEEAGARLTTTWNDTKRAIGEALLPLGAQIQDSLANALRDATPALVEFAKSAAAAIKVLVDNAELIGNVLKTLLGFAAVAGAAIGVTQLAAAIASLAAGLTGLGGAMGVATLAAESLGIAIAAIPGIGWIAAGVSALGLLTVALYNNNDAFRTWANNVATVISSDFKSAWDRAVSIASKATKDIGDLLNGLSNISSSVGSAISSKIENAFGGIIKKVRELWNSLPEPIRRAMSESASNAVGGLLAPGNPVAGYLYGAGVRAAQMGPNAQDSAMFGRYAAGGGASGTPGQLTDWEKLLQKEQERDKEREKQLKAQMDLENKLREAAERNAEQLADLREQSIKRAADLERDLGDQRLQLERSIAESRRRTAEQEEDLLLERERQRLAAAGLSTAGVDAQQELLEISRRYSEQRIQNEEAAVDRQTQLQRQIEEFKAGVADSIGKLQEGYARSVADILQSAGDKLAESMVTGAQKAAGLIAGAPPAPILPPPGSQVGASTLTAGAVQGGKVGVGTLVGLAKAAGFSDRDARIMAAIAMAESSGSSRALNNNPRTGDLSYGLWQINMMGRMGPERRRSFGIGSNDALYDPATNANAARQIFQSQGFNAWSVYRSGAYRQYLPGAMGAIPGGVPAAPGGFNPSSIMGGIRKQGGQLGLASETEKAAQNQKAFNQMLSEYTRKFGSYKQELDAATASGRDQLETQTRMYELLRSGINPEIARQRAETEVMANKEIERLEKLYNQLGIELQNTELTEKQRSNLEQLRSEVDGRLASEQSIVDAIQAQAEQLEALEKNNRLATYVSQLQQQLEDLTNIQNVLITIGQTVESEISGAMSTAVTSVVTGSGSIKQALSDMFANIGQSFIKMATDIIAKQLVMITLQTVLKALGLGFSGGGGGLTGTNALSTTKLTPGGVFADGGIMTSRGPVPLKKYARGGIANSPQMALFGEGSTPEAFVPLPDGRRIPVSLKSQDKMSEIMGRSPVQQQSPTLNMTFQTTNIGGVEYVSRDQLEAAMAETRKAASRDGAKRGMSMTLDRLQQSPTTRRQVGLR